MNGGAARLTGMRETAKVLDRSISTVQSTNRSAPLTERCRRSIRPHARVDPHAPIPCMLTRRRRPTTAANSVEEGHSEPFLESAIYTWKPAHLGQPIRAVHWLLSSPPVQTVRLFAPSPAAENRRPRAIVIFRQVLRYHRRNRSSRQLAYIQKLHRQSADFAESVAFSPLLELPRNSRIGC